MYEKQIWSNVYGETPFSPERMLHIENGIYAIYALIGNIETILASVVGE